MEFQSLQDGILLVDTMLFSVITSEKGLNFFYFFSKRDIYWKTENKI